jgi:UDP-glucose 4-epimerase
MAKIGVTGASGFVGRAICARLSREGYHVRALSRDGTSAVDAAEHVATGNLIDADLPALVEGCVAIVNCAARVHIMQREEPREAERAYTSLNVDLPLRLAEAAKADGARRFVHLSSAAALTSKTAPGETADDATKPRPSTPYGRSKLQADLALATLVDGQFAAVSLRPPAIFGPGVGAWFATFDRAARAGLPMPLGKVGNRRSFAAVANVADAAARAVAGGPSGAYLLTDGPPLSTAALYARLAALHGYGRRVFAMPPALVHLIANAVLGARADSLLGNAAFSGERFAREFAWAPPESLDMALAATIAARRS